MHAVFVIITICRVYSTNFLLVLFPEANYYCVTKPFKLLLLKMTVTTNFDKKWNYGG